MAFNEAASDRKDDVLVVLRSAAHAAEPQNRYRYDETPVQLVARALGSLDALARSPYVHTIVQDMVEALVQAERVMEPAMERRVVGVCECGNALSTTRDEGSVRCRSCEREYDIGEWDQYRDSRVLDQVASPTEICAYFAKAFQVKLTDNEIRRWKRRELLEAVEETATRRRYRVGDVVRVWESWYGKDLPGRRPAQDVVGGL